MTPRRSPRVVAATALVPLLLGVTACGDDGEADDSDASGQSADPTSDTESSAGSGGGLSLELVQAAVEDSDLLTLPLCGTAEWQDGFSLAETYGDLVLEKVYACYPAGTDITDESVFFGAVTYIEYADPAAVDAYWEAEVQTGDVIVDGSRFVSFGASTGEDTAVFDALAQDIQERCDCGELLELP